MSSMLDRIYGMITDGRTIKEISKELGISRENVSARLSELRKLEYDVPRFKAGTSSEFLDEKAQSDWQLKAREACAAHLADLEAVYQRPVSTITPENQVIRYPTGLSASSYCGSPSALAVYFG